MGCNTSTRVNDQSAFYLSSSMLENANLANTTNMSEVFSSTQSRTLGSQGNMFVNNSKDSQNVCDSATPEAVQNVFSTILNESIVSTIVNITSTSHIDQDITLTCTPVTGSSSSGVYEDSETCQRCYNTMAVDFDYFNELTRQTWSKSSSKNVTQDTDRFMSLLIAKSQACATRCKACSFFSVSQSSIMNISNLVDKQVDFSSQLTTNLTTAINQQLTNTQDILSNLVVQQGDVWVTNAINSVVENTVKVIDLNEIITQIQSNQSIVITDSSGIYNGINQHSVENVISDYISHNKVDFNQIIEEYVAIINDIVTDQSSLNAVGDLIISTVGTLLGIVEKVSLYSLYGSMIVVIVIFIALFVNMFMKNYSMVHQDWDLYLSKFAPES